MPIMWMKPFRIVASNLFRDCANMRERASCGVSYFDGVAELHRLS